MPAPSEGLVQDPIGLLLDGVAISLRGAPANEKEMYCCENLRIGPNVREELRKRVMESGGDAAEFAIQWYLAGPVVDDGIVGMGVHILDDGFIIEKKGRKKTKPVSPQIIKSK